MYMNKIFSMALLSLAAATFTACVNEEDDLFDKSAAERLNEASELYSSRLTASPNGWAVQLYPTTENEAPFGNGYLVLFRFHADHSVDASMNNALSNNEYWTDTSNWDVITDMGPVLSFNTWNKVVHAFSEPEDVGLTDDDDEKGSGIGGDYEFIIVDAPEDASYMMLKGKKRGTYNLLTPVEEGVDYQDYLVDVYNFQSKMFPSNTPTFDLLHVGDSLYKMEGADDGLPNIYSYNGNAVIDESFNPFLITKKGSDYYLRFRDKTAYGEKTVQEFKYLTDKDIFQSTDDETSYISGDDPFRYYKQACLYDSLSAHLEWDASDAASDTYAGYVSGLKSSMQSKKYTFNKFRMLPVTDTKGKVVPGKLLFRIFCKYNRRDILIDYNFDYAETENGIKFTYTGASNTIATNALKNFSQIQNLIDALNAEMIVGAAVTGFDLRKLRLTSVSNPDVWFTYSLY